MQRLVTQYFAAGSASRRKARSASVSASYDAASRIASTVAASDSSARSARTLRISGLSISGPPNTSRYELWWTACATACRISPAEPTTQSRRVAATISMMVRTPRPSSPTSRAQVPSNSTSADALDRLPSLSFSRWIRNTLRVPSGSTRGTRKQLSPPGARASTRKPSDIGAEQNHLCPVSRYAPSPDSGSARVVLDRTSLPPCFSVMPIPKSTPAFSRGFRSPPRTCAR